MIQRYRKNGLLHVLLENEHLRLTVLPEFGGKMLELRRKVTGTQFLLPPQQDYIRSRLPSYGEDYLRSGPAGFDECFPTVAASLHPATNGMKHQTAIPDHGELWAIPWEHWISEEALFLSARGVRLPYSLSKTIRLSTESVLLEYKLTNDSGRDLHYLWSPQPLLAIQPGSRILLDEHVTEVLLDWSTDTDLGRHGDLLPWPRLYPGCELDFGVIQPRDARVAIKVYTEALVCGVCGYLSARTGEQIEFRFDPRKLPYVGILFWYNDWPASPGEAFYTVAIQPSSGRPDALHSAYAREECTVIEPQAMQEWSLTIRVGEIE